MEKKDFLLLLDEIMELELGTLTGEEQLKELENWSSLAVVEFIAIVDEKFEFTVSPKKLSEAETVNDLIQLLDGKVTN
ncbi:MAG TPA: phosphopantetheine-binding protein [Terriglobales bacterium]|nr:phosphopantetheine-binding protein [Terriglobales bacterium]